MSLVLGTFNLNNLVSRFDFRASSQEVRCRPARHLADDQQRGINAPLVREKPAEARQRLGERILSVGPDVLAVQEIEDEPTLAGFEEKELGGAYPHRVFVEGNDARLIDVGLLSKLPVGEVRSYRRWVHPGLPEKPIFRRDLLVAEILSSDRARRLCWVAVTQLKSRYLDWRIKDPRKRQEAEREATRIRRLEAESVAAIAERFPARDPWFLCGDLNDAPDSPALEPLLDEEHGVGVNLLARFTRTPEERWTCSHHQTGTPRAFEQLDYILALRGVSRVNRAWVLRRETSPAKPDASDHDPVFCEVEL